MFAKPFVIIKYEGEKTLSYVVITFIDKASGFSHTHLKFFLYQNLKYTLKLRNETGNLSKRPEPDHRADNSRALWSG